MLTIDQIRSAVENVAPQYPIKKVALFGSYADGKAKADSDVDLLVEYVGGPVSLMDILGFEEHMREVLKIHVDAIQYPIVNPMVPSFTVNKVVPLYAQ